MVEEGAGARLVRLVPRAAGAALSAAVVLGFVVLGVAVVAGRSLRSVARVVWGPPSEEHNGGRARAGARREAQERGVAVRRRVARALECAPAHGKGGGMVVEAGQVRQSPRGGLRAGLPARLGAVFGRRLWARRPEPRVRYGHLFLPGLAAIGRLRERAGELVARAEAVSGGRFT